MKKRAVIYTRVSDQSQIDNNSLKTQQETCQKYAEQNGYEVVKIFKEEGKSAKHVYTREKLRELICFCGLKSNSIDAVVVYAFDRFSRNTEEGLAAISLLAKSYVKVVSATQTLEDDPMGRAMRSIMIAFAQLENETKGETVKRNMISVFRDGLWPFKCPVGYKRPYRSKEENKGKPPIQDSNLAPIITSMFRKASKGIYNKTQLAKLMNLSGFGKHYKSKASHKIVDKILKKTFYYGEMYAPKWNESVWGKYVPIIDKKTWEKAFHYVVLKKKNYSFQDESLYPLKGHLNCGKCNKPLTTSPSRGSTKKYFYYECRNSSCGGVRIDSKVAHKQFNLLLNTIKPSSQVLKLFDHMVFREWDKVIFETNKTANEIESRIGKLKEELKSIRRAVDKGIYTNTEAKEQVNEVRKEITFLSIEKSDAKIEQYDKEIVREFTKHFLQNLNKLWEELDLPKQQALLQNMFIGGIACDSNRQIRTIELAQSFKLIQALSTKKGKNVTPRRIELRFLG